MRNQKSFCEKIDDIKYFLRGWWAIIKLHIISKSLSTKKKYVILSQAKNQAETVLKNNNLNVTFRVSLEKIKETKTIALYQRGSSRDGSIKVFYNTHLVGRNIDYVVFNILHEYSHGIFEDVGELFTEDILDLIYITQNTENKPIDFEPTMQKFCDDFALYLLNNTKEDEIGKICRHIIQKYNQLHDHIS